MILLVIFFLSGAIGLVYEVLWLKQLTLIFGNTSHATAIVLAVFFLGLSAGSLFWGKRVRKTKSSLLTYAFLEFGIAVSAIIYFYLFYLTQGPFVLFFIFATSFFMGGTLPVMAQVFVKKRQDFGRTLGLLYALNTLGGVLGALVGGFYLPPTIGFRSSFIFAIYANLALAILVFLISRSKDISHVIKMPNFKEISHTKGNMKKELSIPNRLMALFVFTTGFAILALEVLWTRMFSQVLLNDVYSFSAILVVFLFAIGVSGLVARRLSSLEADPLKIGSFLLILSGILIGLSPFLFILFTGFSFIPSDQGWSVYVIQVFALAFGLVFIPTLALSSLFPYLVQFDKEEKSSGGEILGRWLPINTMGAIVGSLVAGFILLSTIGLWWSIALIAGICFAIGFQKNWKKTIIFVAIFSILPAIGRQEIVVNKENGEVLKEVWQGTEGTVSVMSLPKNTEGGKEDLFIRLNSFYTLGGLQGLPEERRMAHLPIFLHPNPRSIFFIGMGTGITASGALFHPVESVVVTEIIPEVIEASQKYFTAYLNGLYEDPRVRIITGDGRNYLLRHEENYDLIISDLFYPWNIGAGSLYSKEHFTLVMEHLNDDGIFVQWLPLHQLSEFEFGVIARTITSVFPQVTLWRNNFYPERPLVALVAHTKKTPLNPQLFVDNVMRLKNEEKELMDVLLSIRGESVFNSNENLEELGPLLPYLAEITPFTFYGGNITENLELFASYPENTDDRPIIEFSAPKNAGKVRSGEISWLTGKAYGDLSEKIFSELPPEEDPYLKELTQDQKNYIRGGLSLVKYSVAYSESEALKSEGILKEDLLKEADYWFNDYLKNTKIKTLLSSQP